tara:strand:+ start:336 stop:512 length:177 start_codon:yes stop_codon:yes gene_type:complete
MFLVFSFFYYKLTCANATAMQKSTTSQQTKEVLTQQQKIITSLRKIEDRVVTRDVTIK